MDIKFRLILIFVLGSVCTFGQGPTFSVTPSIITSFGTCHQKYQNIDIEGLEILPITKFGNITFSSFNLNLDFSLVLKNNIFGIGFGNQTVQNGFSYIKYGMKTNLSAGYYSLKTAYSRFNISLFYQKALKINQKEVFVKAGLGFNLPKRFEEYSGSQEISEFYVTESNTNNLNSRIGVDLRAQFTLPIRNKKNKEIISFSITYIQGLNRIDNLNIIFYSTPTNQITYLNCYSRASSFSIGISKNIKLFTLKHE